MARNFYTPINLNGLELQGAAIGNLTTTSINAITTGTGRIQYDSTLNVLKYRDNTGWQTISTGGGSFTLGSTSISLGSTTTTVAGLTLSGPTFTGTITTPLTTAGVVLTNGSGVLSSVATLANSYLTNSTISGVSLGGTLGALSLGTGLSYDAGTTYTGGTARTLSVAIGSTSITGIVSLTDSVSSTSTTTAATPNSVKSAYDLANAALPKSGGTMSGAIAMGNNKITGLGTPTAAADAATKDYVDNVSAGINVHDAVAAAIDTTIAGTYAAGSTTANPPGDGGTGVGATITYSATGATVVDTSVTLAQYDRVLVMNGVTASAGTSSIANGIYTVTTAGTTGVATVLTRSADADNSIFGDLSAGDLIYVVGGASYGGDQFVQTVRGTATTGTGASTKYSVKIGTDGINYTQFSGSGAVPLATTSTVGIASFNATNFTVTTGAVNTIQNINTTATPTFGALTSTGAVTAGSIVKSGGTSSQFLKADGSVDSSTYLTSAVTSLAGTTDQITASASTGSVTLSLPSAVTISGAMTAGSFVKSSGTSSQFLKADGSVDSSTYLTSATGVTTVNGSSGAITGVAKKVTQVGSGSGTTIALTHGLGTNLLTAQVYDTSTSTATLVEVDITVTSTTATATFASSTTLSNYTLVVVG